MGELDRFGWDHAAVGAVMCRQWNFPEKLVATGADATHRNENVDSLRGVAAALVSIETEAPETSLFTTSRTR